MMTDQVLSLLLTSNVNEWVTSSEPWLWGVSEKARAGRQLPADNGLVLAINMLL